MIKSCLIRWQPESDYFSKSSKLPLMHLICNDQPHLPASCTRALQFYDIIICHETIWSQGAPNGRHIWYHMVLWCGERVNLCHWLKCHQIPKPTMIYLRDPLTSLFQAHLILLQISLQRRRSSKILDFLLRKLDFTFVNYVTSVNSVGLPW